MQSRWILALVLLASAAGARASAQAPWQNPYYGTAPFFDELEVGDADGDGQSDVFVVSQVAHSLKVLLGHGDGSFVGPYQQIKTNVSTFVVADFDADGLDDVATIDASLETVSVCMALGGGTYGSPIPVPATGPAASLTSADLDGDGHLDLALGLIPGQRVSLALGAGDGSFVAGPDVIVPALHDAVRAGDVNGDGIADLVTWRLSGGNNGLDVEIGLGALAYQLPLAVFAGMVEALDVGDVDGDGSDDLAVLSTSGKIFYGQVGGLPGPAQETGLSASYADTLRIADVDDDGRPDLLLGGGSFMHAKLQLAAGGFDVFGQKVSSGTYGSSDLGIADLDHDGQLDVLAAGLYGDLITVLIGQGDGGFRPSYADDLSEGYAFELVPADFDLDGRLDLLSQKLGGGSTIPPLPLRHGEFDATFAQPVEVSIGLRPRRMAASDATGDGVPDILAIGWGASPDPLSYVSITPGHGDFSFGTPNLTPVISFGAVGDFVDFNADGLLDAVVVGETGGDQWRLSMMIDQGGSFALDSTLVFTLGAHWVDQVVATDLDADGVTDVVLRCHGPYVVQVMLGVATGGFTGPTPVLAASRLEHIELADVTQDGQLDLVASAYDDQELLVAAGHGDGSFDPPASYATGKYPGTFLIADMDDDGLPDVLLGDSDIGVNPQMTLFLGQPGGTLLPSTTLPLAGHAAAFHLADVDNDAKLDLLIAGGNQIVTLLSTTGPWRNLGHSLAGSHGFSKLVGEGSLEPGSRLALEIVHGPPFAPVFLVLGKTTIDAPFKGGTLVPQPLDVKPLGSTNAAGALRLLTKWPTGPAPGTTFIAQAWFLDPGGPAGFAATNAIQGTSP